MNWVVVYSLLAIVVYTVFLAQNIFAARRKGKTMNQTHDIQIRRDMASFHVSIIIPARDEAQNIVRCLQSIVSQEFPKEQFEILVVNDHSSDETARIAGDFLADKNISHKIISLAENEKGKKTALLKGVEEAKGEIIITRDADTFGDDKEWLKKIVLEFENNQPDLLLLPVLLSGNNSFAATFQRYENLAISMLGFGMARNNLPMVCAGANLAYRKEFFQKLQPYQNNLHIASGDDMFLLKKAYQQKAKIGSLNAAVQTPAGADLKSAFHQRIRWAAKGAKLLTGPIFFSSLVLLAGNLAALVALICPLIDASYLAFGLFGLLIKLLIDFLLLFLSARMFKTKLSPAWFIPAFIFNLFYTPVIALCSVLVKPIWKGRRI